MVRFYRLIELDLGPVTTLLRGDRNTYFSAGKYTVCTTKKFEEEDMISSKLQ